MSPIFYTRSFTSASQGRFTTRCLDPYLFFASPLLPASSCISLRRGLCSSDFAQSERSESFPVAQIPQPCGGVLGEEPTRGGGTSARAHGAYKGGPLSLLLSLSLRLVRMSIWYDLLVRFLGHIRERCQTGLAAKRHHPCHKIAKMCDEAVDLSRLLHCSCKTFYILSCRCRDMAVDFTVSS